MFVCSLPSLYSYDSNKGEIKKGFECVHSIKQTPFLIHTELLNPNTFKGQCVWSTAFVLTLSLYLVRPIDIEYEIFLSGVFSHSSRKCKIAGWNRSTSGKVKRPSLTKIHTFLLCLFCRYIDMLRDFYTRRLRRTITYLSDVRMCYPLREAFSGLSV